MKARVQGGFTLLELLIGITLVGFILVLLFAGLRLGVRSWDTGEAQLERSTQIAMLQSFLRRQLSQAVPHEWQDGDETIVAFSGVAGALQMIAPLGIRHEPGGLQLINLQLRKTDEGVQELIMRRIAPGPKTKDFSALEQVKPVLLARGIKSLHFSYFGPGGKTSPPLWHDNWVGKSRLPLLIKVALKFEDTSDWPDLVVATIIGTNTGCTWDYSKGYCVSP